MMLSHSSSLTLVLGIFLVLTAYAASERATIIRPRRPSPLVQRDDRVRGRARRTRALKSSSGKAEAASGSSNKSMASDASKKAKSGGNIFDHTQTTQERIPVECGSEEQPFLTTFVTSVEFKNYASSVRKGKSSSGKSTSGKSQGKSTASSGKSAAKSATASGKSVTASASGTTSSSQMTSLDDPMDNGMVGEVILPEDLIVLNATEEAILERIFKDVYNAYTFESCDGFFRTVYVANMVLAEPKPDEEYAVFLARSHGTASSRTDDADSPTEIETEDIEESSSDGESSLPTRGPAWSGDTADDERLLQSLLTSNNSTNTSTPRQSGEESSQPARTSATTQTSTQRVVGGYYRTIYYVVVTATCRNCPVTPEVNFPLLELRQGDGDSQDADASQSFMVSPLGHDDMCMCPAYYGESASYRARRHMQEESNSLPVPQPNGPTAEELIQAINLAIRQRQLEDGQLEGIVGLSQLIEPDYFNGENPGRVTITASPTISPMPTVSPAPTVAPTISPAPTVSPAPTGSPTTSPAPTISPRPTASPTLAPIPLPTKEPTRRPTAPPITRRPTTAPVSSTPAPTSGAGIVLLPSLLVNVAIACLLATLM